MFQIRNRFWIYVVLLLFATTYLSGVGEASGSNRCGGCGENAAHNKENGRYSMFIHWGLYSVYGGVYRGKNVEWGYSEQIQSFAGIFSDWYARAAKEFTASKWDADEIAKLAKQAGMDGVVMTSKHHDGFCMYDSEFTNFSVVKATPFGRDALKEMSDACRRHGLNFGIYFSLIDWHYPWAYPISSHNADPITAEHHEYNKKQVRELLTNYGSISELWFDMGSLTRDQSRELYNLVKSIQPDCLVSGRIGNDYGDFAVMPDNTIPDFDIEKPWQTAESVYKETWGYRSWQKHVPLSEKVEEKIGSLKRIISAGGNYLLNIGPRGDGSVTDYERELLISMGRWIDSTGWLKQINSYAVKSDFKSRGVRVGGKTVMFLKDAKPVSTYSMFDYYNTGKVVYCYRWYISSLNRRGEYRFIIPDILSDFELIDMRGRRDTLKNRREVPSGDKLLLHCPAGVDPELISVRDSALINVDFDETVERVYDFESPQDGVVSFRVGVADAVEIWQSDTLLLKRMFTKDKPEPFVFAVPVVKGLNSICVKLYNRFSNSLNYSLSPVETRYFEIW